MHQLRGKYQQKEMDSNVATLKNQARTDNPNLPVDMKEGVSPHHLLLGSNQELLNVNPGPKIYKEDIKFYINKMKQNGN